MWDDSRGVDALRGQIVRVGSGTISPEITEYGLMWEKPQLLGRSLPARSVIETLYRTILGRELDPAGEEHFTNFIAAGGTSDEVAARLLESPEYKARNAAPKHPLGSLSRSYTDEDASYFMHRGRFRPLTLMIETINICNNDCVICPYSAQTRKRGTMSPPLFEKVVRDYAAIGGGPVSLTPLVGEALLDKHLMERLKFLNDNSSISSVSVTTNAVMAHRFDDEYLRSILSLINRVKISVYGLDREEYATMTKKDEYELFRKNVVRILSMAKAGSVVFGIRYLKDRSVADIQAWCAELERESGAKVEIASMTNTFANWSHFDTSKPLPLQGRWKSVPENTKQCGIPLLSVQILSDGRVSFCACANFDGAPDLMIGDLNNNSLSEILESEEVAALWNWERCGVPEFCKTCSFHTPLSDLGRVEWVYRDPIRYIGG